MNAMHLMLHMMKPLSKEILIMCMYISIYLFYISTIMCIRRYLYNIQDILLHTCVLYIYIYLYIRRNTSFLENTQFCLNF